VPSMLFMSARKGIGTLITVGSSALIAKSFSLGFEAGCFVAGDYVKETGKGSNIHYASVKVNYKF